MRLSQPVLTRLSLVATLAGVTLAVACASKAGSGTPAAAGAFATIDSAKLLSDVQRLSHDTMAGRAVGTPENAKARAYLVSELRRIGIAPVPGAAGYELPFARARRNGGDSIRGVNVAAYVPGPPPGNRVIVVSAHYDHVGVRNGQIYNGADDNASGTAGVLALAQYFKAHPPKNAMLFVFFDAEELGLVGARAFVDAPPIPLSTIAVNVNMDMVSRSDSNWLYAAGAAHYPQLRPILESVVPDAPVKLRLGHDSGPAREDWTYLSDQGAFHDRQIPSLLFSVEDHADYHKPTDDFANLDVAFYVGSVRTVAEFVKRLDAALPLPQTPR